MGVKRVTIDAFPESAARHARREALVAVDVITASTTMVTAAALGRPVFPALDLVGGLNLARLLGAPHVASDDPKAQTKARPTIVSLSDVARETCRAPLVVGGADGARLLASASGNRNVYVACLRNLSATAAHLAASHSDVVIVAAGHDGQARYDDEIAAAHLARRLVDAGFECTDGETADIVKRMGDADLGLAGLGRSASTLRRQGRHRDVDFVLEHVDDLPLVCAYAQGTVAVLDTEGRPHRPRADERLHQARTVAS
jgi:hypothetical protein